jgi:hypothetical protein
MDEERFQQVEKWLNEQVEATQAMNKSLNKFIVIMGNQEAARNVEPPSPVIMQTPHKPWNRCEGSGYDYKAMDK